MTWNYRIIRKTKRLPGRLRTDGKSVLLRTYDIHEVFYNKKGEPKSWTVEPVSPNGHDSLKDLEIELAMMLTDALKHPVMEIVGNKLVERNRGDKQSGEGSDGK